MKEYKSFLAQEMSMTGSGNEEATAKSSEKLDKEASTVDNAQLPTKPCSSDLNRCFSPMLGVFGRREFVPSLLEHEKALLVAKEHNYAKAPERPEVLQLSSIYAKELSEQNEELGDLNSLMNVRADLLLLRERVDNERSEPSVVCHLRQVVGLQVALIREQQEQLHEKDKDLNAVKKEKEQLEARLERKERRLAILQKHSRLRQNDVNNAESPTSPLTPAPPNSLMTPVRAHLTRRESIIASETSVRSRSASVEPGSRNRSRPSSRAGSPSRDNDSAVKRSHKRKIRDEDEPLKTPRKKTKHQRELRTEVEYGGLDLPIPKQRSNSQSEPSQLANHTGPESSENECVPIKPEVDDSIAPCGDDPDIVTPSWRSSTIIELLPESTLECEDMSDEVYNRRHKKPEEDEKRRKRWDMQRARALREHHELLRKYNMKSGGEKGQEKKETEKPVASFIPDLCEIDTIEVMDTVTVSAFGKPLPVIKASEFELPWFDLDVRESKETVRKTRSKTKTNRASVGGSADES